MRVSARFVGAAFVLTASLGGPQLFAQTAGTTNIEGVVTDATGAVLPGVAVVIRNMDTNATRELTSDAGGRYRAVALQPGRYEVKATLSAFTANAASIEAQVGQTVPVDIQMRPGGITEEVNVIGEATVDTKRTDVASVVSQAAVENLPINGRRWENFVLLSPGVTNDGGFGLVSYRGISGLYNNNTVDGADNNQAFFSEARGRTRVVYTISQESIQEFQVGISNFSAEFGRAAGGSVNAVTKSGSNEYHGEAFYFLRKDDFQSKDPFATFKPSEKRQQFGVSIGGPIQKDKAFFFFNYDQQVRDFPYFTKPNDATYLNQTCTAPGCAATVAFLQSVGTNPNPRTADNNILLGKVDVVLNKKHTLTLQYNRQRWNSPNGVQTAPIVSTDASANGSDIVRTDFALLKLNSVFSSNSLNEFRFQYGRDFEAQTPNAPGPSIVGGISFGQPNFLPRPQYPDERRTQVIDNYSYFVGAHSLKVGLDINYVKEGIINLFQGGGVYNYSNLQNLAADCPPEIPGCVPLLDANAGRHYSSYTQSFDLRPGLRGDAQFSTTDWNFFVQDTWNPTRKLTVNLGLRYEYQQLPQFGSASTNGVPFTGNPKYPLTQQIAQDKNDWGPRLGLVYDISGNHTTVLRGGFGIYYGRTSNSVLFNALTNNAVTIATYSLGPTAPGAPTAPNVLAAPPTTPGSTPSIQFLAPDLKRPQIYMADATIERAIGRDVTVSASYLYSKGKRLPLFVDTNISAPTAQVVYVDTVGTSLGGPYPFYQGPRPDTSITGSVEVLGAAESQYNALVLQVNKRFSQGLLFNANYTLSKATDSGQNSTTFISSFSSVFDPNNPGLEQGTSDFDRRHRFVGYFLFNPDYLKGFALSGTLTLESGLPISSNISGGISGCAACAATSTFTTNGTGGSSRAPFIERNSDRQTGRKNLDLRLSKSFKIDSKRQIQAIYEVFNVLNWTNYTAFGNNKYLTSGSSTYDPATKTVKVTLIPNAGYLLPTSASNTLFGPRDMQLALKFIF